MDNYTYEDYLKDFELDYLGFDGVPGEPGPEEDGFSEDEDMDEDIHDPCLRFQK